MKKIDLVPLIVVTVFAVGFLKYRGTLTKKTAPQLGLDRTVSEGCVREGGAVACNDEYDNSATQFLKLSEEKRMKKLYVDALPKTKGMPTVEDWASYKGPALRED
mgnify:CR=1 FL=1